MLNLKFAEKIDENRKKLKILWVGHSRILDRHTHLSGSERIERVRYLSKEGNDVFLIAADFEKEYYPRNSNMHLISIPLRYVPMVSPLLYGFVLFFFLPFYLVKTRPDFVISDVSPSPFLIWKPVLSRLLKFKMTLDIRSTPVNPFGLRGYLTNIYFSISVCMAKKMFDGMTIVTPMMRKEICQAFNISPSWVGILSNGVSNDFLECERLNHDRMELRRKFGLSNRFVILYHGSLRVPTGGLVESIKAIALIKKDCPDIIFFLLGYATPLGLRLMEKAIEENGLENFVVIHGPINFYEVPKYIAMSDLGIVPLPNIPTWRNQQPMKLLEYIAMKKTVVISDCPANRSIIGNNKNGIYVPHVDPGELAKAIKYAYDNRDKLEQWGEIGRDIVMRKYVWKKVNEDLVNYLFKIQLAENKEVRADQGEGKNPAGTNSYHK